MLRPAVLLGAGSLGNAEVGGRGRVYVGGGEECVGGKSVDVDQSSAV
jgi:hypothetical protein